MADSSEDNVVKLRGLPYSATVDEIEKFLDDCNIVRDGIKFILGRDGRPSGEAFVELQTEADVNKALGKHRENLGSRYIEIFRSKKGHMDWDWHKPVGEGGNDSVVRLRGLPFGVSKEEIAQFFQGLQIVRNGITLPTMDDGRGTGHGFVQFASKAIAEEALKKHKERIGHRYIEIFPSSLGEIRDCHGPMRTRGFVGPPQRMAPYERDRGAFGPRGGPGMMGGGPRTGMMGAPRDMQLNEYGEYLSNMIMERLKGSFDRGQGRLDNFGGAPGGAPGGGPTVGYRQEGGYRGGGGDMDMRGGRNGVGSGTVGRTGPGSNYRSTTGHSVHMRGIPFSATESDVREFFHPVHVSHVDIEYQSNGRAAGSANVDFSSHQEAIDAMKKDRQNMQHRYVELFLNSSV